jgi:hypothetical protein
MAKLNLNKKARITENKQTVMSKINTTQEGRLLLRKNIIIFLTKLLKKSEVISIN